MKNLAIAFAAIPALALFGGIGILAWRIGDTWTDATTQGLVTGLTVVCGGGTLVVCILLALIVGVPLVVRIFGEAGISHRAWGAGRGAPYWDDVPPAVRRPPVIHGEWRELPPPSPAPPWGVTGGGSPHLPPPPRAG